MTRLVLGWLAAHLLALLVPQPALAASAYGLRRAAATRHGRARGVVHRDYVYDPTCHGATPHRCAAWEADPAHRPAIVGT